MTLKYEKQRYKSFEGCVGELPNDLCIGKIFSNSADAQIIKEKVDYTLKLRNWAHAKDFIESENRSQKLEEDICNPHKCQCI